MLAYKNRTPDIKTLRTSDVLKSQTLMNLQYVTRLSSSIIHHGTWNWNSEVLTLKVLNF